LPRAKVTLLLTAMLCASPHEPDHSHGLSEPSSSAWRFSRQGCKGGCRRALTSAHHGHGKSLPSSPPPDLVHLCPQPRWARSLICIQNIQKHLCCSLRVSGSKNITDLSTNLGNEGKNKGTEAACSFWRPVSVPCHLQQVTHGQVFNLECLAA